MYRQYEKKNLLNSNVSHTYSQYGELWHRSLASLGHPSKFQRVSLLGRVTARHSSSGRKPKFAALNRMRHLHSEGRPLRWALAHILVVLFDCAHSIMTVLCLRDLARCWLKITNFFSYPTCIWRPVEMMALEFCKGIWSVLSPQLRVHATLLLCRSAISVV